MLLALVPALAQEWELGFGGGAGISRGADITNPIGSVRAGFQHGPMVGVYGGQNWKIISGEVRYMLKFTQSRLNGQGTSAEMSAQAHSVHFDFLFHPKEKKLQPYFVAGFGIRYYRGTGTEDPTQPLLAFASLRNVGEVKPLLAPGVGIKARAGRLVLRVEIRDYITPFPEKVIAVSSAGSSTWNLQPPDMNLQPSGRTGSSLHGWLHDLTPMVTLGFTF